MFTFDNAYYIHVVLFWHRVSPVSISTVHTEGPRPHHEEVGENVVRRTLCIHFVKTEHLLERVHVACNRRTCAHHASSYCYEDILYV